MGQSTKELIAEKPRETRLLLFVLMSDLVFFLNSALKTVVVPVSGVQDRGPFMLVLLLTAAFLLRTVLLYGASGLLTCILRVFGGTGSWQATRAAVFWGALVAAPFGVLLTMVAVLFRILEPVMPVLGDHSIALLLFWISVMPFLWFVSAGLSAAHGMRNTNAVFLPMLGGTMVLMIMAMIVVVLLG